MDVEQTSKDLITDDLDIEVCQSFFAFLLDQTVKVTLVVCHNYLNLTVFVFRILENFFNCDYLACFFDFGPKNFAERSLADDFYEFDIVGR